MKSVFLIGFALLLSLQSFAQAQAPANTAPPTLTDYIRTAPVYLIAHVKFEKPHRLFHSEIAGREYLRAYIRKDQELRIRVSKTDLQINTVDGLRLSIAGIPINITSLHYNNVTREVQAKSSLLGVDAGNFYVEQRVAKEIKNKFLPKLQEAFARLLKVRQQQSLSAAGDMLNSVINVFKDEPKPGQKRGPPLPTFTGSLTLVTQVTQSLTLGFGEVVADLQEGDVLSTTLMVRVPCRAKMQVRGFMFNSATGIGLRQAQTTSESIKRAILTSFWATEGDGFQIAATNGADSMIDSIVGGANLLVGILAFGSKTSPLKINQSTLIQGFINAKAQKGLSQYVIDNRPKLLKAGATPELLDALERSN